MFLFVRDSVMKEGVADLVSSKGFSLSLLRCQESTAQNTITDASSLNTTTTTGSGGGGDDVVTQDHKTTLHKVEDRLRDGRSQEGRPQQLNKMTNSEMLQEKTALQKALLYYESVHGRPNTRDTRELARPIYDRYRQVKRSVSRAQAVSVACDTRTCWCYYLVALVQGDSSYYL